MFKRLRKWTALALALILALAALPAFVEPAVTGEAEAKALYEQGYDAFQAGDYEKALEAFRESAEMGYGAAYHTIGVMYYYGMGVEQSYASTVEYMEMAVAAEYPDYDALNELGYFYAAGDGVEQDYGKAAEYFEQAAALDQTVAMIWLGALYAEGTGVERDDDKALAYFQRAAELGDGAGYSWLGYFAMEGRGMEPSREKAIEYYTKAAELGVEEAAQELAGLRAEEAGYGLVQTEGIVIPDYTKETVKQFEIPDTEATAFARKLGVGWDLGNTFDARDEGPGDPNRDYETYWCGTRTSRWLIRAIRGAGFNVLRMPVSWHNHLINDQYTIDPAWLGRVQEVADWALEEGMYVIINIHHDNETGYLFPDEAHYEQSEKYITAIWSQVAERFAEYDEHLIFEAMNEPRIIGAKNEWWADPSDPVVLDAVLCINRLNRKFVETVRAAGGKNAERFLMVPGYAGSYKGVTIDEFELPEDDRLIVEVHAYAPYDYALNADNPDSSFDLQKDTKKKSEIAGIMNGLYEKFVSRGVPVVIDEFGAMRKNEEDLQGRVNYAAFYTAMASARGIPVVWWDNANVTAPGEKFGLIDRNALEWIFPDIALALVRNCRVNREE